MLDDNISRHVTPLGVSIVALFCITEKKHSVTFNKYLHSLIELIFNKGGVFNDLEQNLHDEDIELMMKISLQARDAYNNAVQYLKLFNPNNEALQVKSLKLTALIEGVELDAVDQNYDTKMLGKSTFLLPMNVGLSLKELAKKDSTDIMSKGLRIYNSGAIDLTLHGVLTLSDGVSNKVVNIDHTQNISFSKNIK